MAIDPIRPTDDTARSLATDLLRCTRSAMLATHDPGGYPAASLVLLATAMDGTPLTLVSALSAHSVNLSRDTRASLLLARTGKGDPLAHPRLSIEIDAEILDRSSERGLEARHRLLAHHPKAALYIDFPDFSLVAMRVRRASLNGGFGKAYHLTPDDLIIDGALTRELQSVEAEALAHMNDDHAKTVALYATALLGAGSGRWLMAGIDPDGCTLACNETLLHLPFPSRVTTAPALHQTLAELALQARKG